MRARVRQEPIEAQPRLARRQRRTPWTACVARRMPRACTSTEGSRGAGQPAGSVSRVTVEAKTPEPHPGVRHPRHSDILIQFWCVTDPTADAARRLGLVPHCFSCWWPRRAGAPAHRRFRVRRPLPPDHPRSASTLGPGPPPPRNLPRMPSRFSRSALSRAARSTQARSSSWYGTLEPTTPPSSCS